MASKRQVISIDDRGRSYLTKLGFKQGGTLVADPVEGENLAWIIRPGRIVTDIELSILANPSNLESLIRAGQESEAEADTIELN
ncbi:MAG: hypothetical protein DRJ28_05250 [Actinobacteria bacterium]|nr:MAG: hypothetical protein DRJ28_05250 [Actinomycetota bacterium]